MHAAVDFDDEAGLGADEVSDAATDANLPTKGEAQAAAFERRPRRCSESVGW
jgi:hypothetical protein